MPTTQLYPDVLGALTGGDRCSINILEAALAAHPAQVYPGVPFGVFLVLQNTADTRVDVTVTLQLPKAFVAPKETVGLTLSAYEVGYAALPVAVRAGVDAGSTHKVGVDVEVRPQSKAKSDRQPGGDLSPAVTQKVQNMARLDFVTKRRGRSSIEVPVTVGSGQPAKANKPAAGWFSLWSLENADDVFLIQRCGALVRTHTFKQLTRDSLLPPLRDLTQKRFEAVGYPLKPEEVSIVAKLMMLVVEYGQAGRMGHDPITAGTFEVLAYLKDDWQPGEIPPQLPRWFQSLLRHVVQDERIAAQPMAILPKLYLLLLRDSVDLGFKLVTQMTGVELGTEADMREYGDNLLERLKTTGEMDFAHAYMPLVIGGTVISDTMALPDEDRVETLRQLWIVLDQRRGECDDDSQPIYDIAEDVLEDSLQKYGHRRSSL